MQRDKDDMIPKIPVTVTPELLQGPWTSLFDMHSGGGLKEPPYDKLYIQAPEEEAKIIFQNLFGHNPDRVTCTCCGSDYSIDEADTFTSASAFHRNCESDRTGKFDKAAGKWVYESGGPFLESGPRYITVPEYVEKGTVFILPATEIKPEWRKGKLRRSGYVWVDDD